MRGMTVKCNLWWNFGDISRWIPRQMVASQAKDFLATPRDLHGPELFGIFLHYCRKLSKFVVFFFYIVLFCFYNIYFFEIKDG